MADYKNLMVSVSGIRGIIGDGLTPEVVLKFSQAYGSEFGPGTVVVGRDSRVSGEMVKNTVVAGLLSVGCSVVDIGIAPTPTTELATEKADHSGGIIITASHNPKEWNALKLLGPEGLFLTPEQGERVIERFKNDDYSLCAWDGIGTIEQLSTAVQEHLERIKQLPVINVGRIRDKNFKIVADCCNGAGGTILPQLFEEFGCEYVILNEEPNGFFPRSPEPIPQNLGELCQAVKRHNADLGIAVDPDVDRLALVSENGRPLGEEYTLALATHFVLSKTTGDVVVNASTSQAIDDITEKFGGTCFRSQVGEIHVATKAQELNAVMAGEGNGGVIYPAAHLGRDAPVGIALVLQMMAEEGRTISQIHASMPQYTMIKDKVQLPFDANAKGTVEKLKDQHAGDNMDTIDGVKILLEKSWVHIRASNTEPIIRVIAEASTLEAAQALVEQYKNEILDLTKP